MRKKGGRPTVWSEEIEARLLDALSIGASLKAAAGAAGVNYATASNRMGIDEAWRDRVEEARARAALKAAKTVASLMDHEDPRVALKAALAYLAAHDEEWRPQQKIEHAGGLTLTGFLQEITAARPDHG